jgi:hypothetical protein
MTFYTCAYAGLWIKHLLAIPKTWKRLGYVFFPETLNQAISILAPFTGLIIR